MGDFLTPFGSSLAAALSRPVAKRLRHVSENVAKCRYARIWRRSISAFTRRSTPGARPARRNPGGFAWTGRIASRSTNPAHDDGPTTTGHYQGSNVNLLAGNRRRARSPAQLRSQNSNCSKQIQGHVERP